MSYFLRLLAIVTAIAIPTTVCAASPYDAAATSFATKVKALAGAGPVTVTYKNEAGLDSVTFKDIQRAIDGQIRASGVRVALNSPDLVITLSRNPRGWLWIAELPSGTRAKIAMLETSEPAESSGTLRAGIALRKQSLIKSERPILDVLHITSPAGAALLALTDSGVQVYQQNGSRWALQQEVGIQRDLPMPRDPYGHLVSANDHLFDAYLPGMVCASGTELPIKLTCRDGDDLWPLGGQSAFFNANRNFFTGLMRPGFSRQAPAFYSAAPIGSGDLITWILAGVDGKVITSPSFQPLGGTADWGSDIATLHSGCVPVPQVLADSRSAESDNDSVRSYQLNGRQATATSPPLELGGTVSAIWSHEAETSVVVVVHHREPEDYEAYSVDLSCN